MKHDVLALCETLQSLTAPCLHVGKRGEIRALDYIEGVGQEVGYYVSELRKRKYGP